MESVFANWFFFCVGVFLCSIIVGHDFVAAGGVFFIDTGYRQLG